MVLKASQRAWVARKRFWKPVRGSVGQFRGTVIPTREYWRSAIGSGKSGRWSRDQPGGLRG